MRAPLRLLGVSEENSSYTGKNVLVLNRNEAFREVVESSLAGHHSETLLGLNDLSCQIIANPVLTDGTVAGAVLLLVDVTEKRSGKPSAGNSRPMSPYELKTPFNLYLRICRAFAEWHRQARGYQEIRGAHFLMRPSG